MWRGLISNPSDEPSDIRRTPDTGARSISSQVPDLIDAWHNPLKKNINQFPRRDSLFPLLSSSIYHYPGNEDTEMIYASVSDRFDTMEES